MGSHEEDSSLFETKRAKGRVLYRLYVLSMLVGICLVWAYRVITIPRRKDKEGRWVWIGLLGAEVWFGLCWVLSQALRWNPVYRFTCKDRLSQRYEKDLPKVDIFVCTADPTIEPPIMVINTVLSAMAYDYPPEKLAVYLSDDGGSDITFYALVEASHFATLWIPYCKKFIVLPRSPAAHFSSVSRLQGVEPTKDFLAIKELYEEMKERIENAAKIGRVPEEARYQCEAYSQWGSSYTSRRDHDTILQILIDGRDVNVKDADGCAIPSLIYLAREKRPQYHHNFKAGALNALIRVSSKISNGEILLNLDCDMYSNDSQTIRDALCFFMDEKQSHDIAFVQCCPLLDNASKNDIYNNSLRVVTNVEFHGLDGFGGPSYSGSGCFHRKDVLCSKKYTKTCVQSGKGYGNKVEKIEGSTQKLEE